MDSDESHRRDHFATNGCFDDKEGFHRCTHLLANYLPSEATRFDIAVTKIATTTTVGATGVRFGFTYSQFDHNQAQDNHPDKLDPGYDGPCPSGIAYTNPLGDKGDFKHLHPSGHVFHYTAEVFAMRVLIPLDKTQLDGPRPLSRAKFYSDYRSFILEHSSKTITYTVP